MAILTDLPLELLQPVYHYLPSIDDVHHLARACKTTYQAIQRPTVYVEVMRSVISNSPTHRYDLQLCRMLDLHQTIVVNAQATRAPVQATTPQPGSQGFPLNHVEILLSNAITDMTHLQDERATRIELSDARVYDILVRWQGLKPLQDMWISRPLKDDDFLSFEHNVAAPDAFARSFNRIRERHRDLAGQRDQDYCFFDCDQRHRFHATVTYLWLLNEIRWVLSQFDFRALSFSIPLQILDSCKEQLDKQVAEPLLDHLDTYSVYSFLYQHLLPLNALPLANQCTSRLPLTFSSDLRTNSGDLAYRARFLQLCLIAGQVYLQPPDIIDLAVRSQMMRRQPWPLVSLPDSTYTYIRPYNAFNFVPGYSLLSPDPDNALRQSLASSTVMTLRLLQRASFTQSANNRAALNLVHPTDPQHLYTVPDLVEKWFNQRVRTQFDMYARQDRPSLDETFDESWKLNVRWAIWWFACSGAKARAKFERWREQRNAGT